LKEAFLDKAVLEYFDSISKKVWLKAFEMWKKEMKRYIQVKRDNFEKL